MYNLLMALLLAISVLLIIAVLLQPAKSNDAMSALTGGAGDLFSPSKARGFEAFMKRVTAILGASFFIVALLMAWIQVH